MRALGAVLVGLAVVLIVAVLVYLLAVVPGRQQPLAIPTSEQDSVPIPPSSSVQPIPDLTLTAPPSPIGTPVTFSDLVVGTCLLNPYTHITGDEREPLARLESVPCTDPHFSEVYYLGQVDDGPFPGDEALVGVVQGVCIDQFAAYVGADYSQSRYAVDMFYPTSSSWSTGDRAYACLAYGEESITGSVAGSGQ